MLIRCEKCGEVFPDDIGKCPRCREPAPPKPPEPPKDLEKEAKQKAKDKKVANITQHFVTPMLISLVLGIVLTIGGCVAMDILPTGAGVTVAIVGLVCLFIFVVLLVSVILIENFAEEKLVVAKKTNLPSPEEYEQRIRDFVSRQ